MYLNVIRSAVLKGCNGSPNSCMNQDCKPRTNVFASLIAKLQHKHVLFSIKRNILKWNQKLLWSAIFQSSQSSCLCSEERWARTYKSRLHRSRFNTQHASLLDISYWLDAAADRADLIHHNITGDVKWRQTTDSTLVFQSLVYEFVFFTIQLNICVFIS